MRISTLALSAVLAGFGCTAEVDDGVADDVAVTSAALSVCEESVPANRNVDGIPSYAQCPDSENSAIYSNNGVDTSTTKLDSTWVRTQYSGGYQCTELAHRYLYFKWDVDWIPNGNAGEWCDEVPPASSGLEQADTAMHGDLIVFAPGSCGASPEFGHVAVIDVVEASGRLTVVEQNGARRGGYEASCAHCFLHVVANTGEGGASGIGGAGGEGGASGIGGAGGIGGMAAAGSGATGGTGGAGGGAPSAGAGGVGASGIGGAGGASSSDGGASGMMIAQPSGGTGGAAGLAGAAGMSTALPTAGAQAAPIVQPRDQSDATESCTVSRISAHELASSPLGGWMLLACAALLRSRKRRGR